MKILSEKERCIWLSLAIQAGARRAKRLVDGFGGDIDAIYEASAESYKAICRGISEREIKSLLDKDLSDAKKTIAQCEKKGIRIITLKDIEYPDRLWEIANPPIVLYAKGEKLSIDSEVAIAIVGTRKTTKNGEESAKKIARELAFAGATVVTGLARGIDSFAARAALSAGGKIIGVLGCGLDICYPRENKKLFEEAIKSGTLISEYPPGIKPIGSNFPKRNRIISGISLGTAVIEAPDKSGALITAAHALEQNRDVFAVPAGIFEDAALGSNRLIREGAVPIMSGGDIMLEYINVYGDKIKPIEPEEKPVEEKNDIEEANLPSGYPNGFSQDECAIIEALGGEELRADDIAARSGMNMPKILTILTLLEIRGCIKQLAGGRYCVKKGK